MTLNHPWEGPSAWRGPSLGSEWIEPLSQAERDELSRACDALAGRELSSIERDAAPLPLLGPRLAAFRRELQHGRGFLLVRGVPIEGRSVDEAARMYWLIGRHLGDPVPQNGAGDLLCDIRDTGADPTDVNTRLYTTRAEQDFHTDGADLIGLLALKPARSGGVSRIVSSVSVFNALLARRPDLVPLLFEPWHFHLHGQFPPGFPASFEMPICRFDGTHLSTFFLGWYIRRAQTLPEVPRLTPAQDELLRLFEDTANDPALYLDMEFRPGDVQWLKNSVILHKRTEYEDWPEPERRRHLLRLWLAARDFADGDERLREGMTVR